MEENIHFPERLYASDDDLSSDGKLILCSRYQMNTDDVEFIKGKKIILIDDSIVRGTTSKQLLDLVKEAEPAEIHFLVGCAPVISPCY